MAAGATSRLRELQDKLRAEPQRRFRDPWADGLGKVAAPVQADLPLADEQPAGPTDERTQAEVDLEAWVRDVRDPAEAGKKWRREVKVGKEALLIYWIVQVPKGWALKYSFDLETSHVGSTWRLFETVAACLASMLDHARAFFANGPHTRTPKVKKALAKMAEKLANFVEPAPIVEPEAKTEPVRSPVEQAQEKVARSQALAADVERRQREAEEADKVAPASTDPSLTFGQLGPTRGTGHRLLADLDVCGHPARLWLEVDGQHVVYFDCGEFGNWDRSDLPHDKYRPAVEDVVKAAESAAGYRFEGAEDWYSAQGSAERLWAMTLICERDNHPEAWRTVPLAELFLPGKWAGPLAKVGLCCLGELHAHLEQWGGKLAVKGIPAKAVPELLQCVRAWWVDNVGRGETGKAPLFFVGEEAT